MAALRPRDREALLALYGVGQRKLEKYADAFLQIIADHPSFGTAPGGHDGV